MFCRAKNLPVIIALIFTALAGYGQTVELIGFTQHGCNQNIGARTVRSRVISRHASHDTLSVTLGFAIECCSQPKGVAYVLNDTLHLNYIDWNHDKDCHCVCMLTLEYKVRGIKDGDIPVKFAEKFVTYADDPFETFKVSYEVSGNDTINYRDKYGLRQGRWFDDNNIHLHRADQSRSSKKREASRKRFTIYRDDNMIGWGSIGPKGDLEEYNYETWVWKKDGKTGPIDKSTPMSKPD